MQKDSFSDKTTGHVVKNPCNLLEPCSYDDEYDPCESSDDITEKDLAILLREEAAKLEKKSNLEEVEGLQEEEGDEGNVPEDKLIWEDSKKKKKTCKNPIKNPFFTNPLKFSSNLPPPPSAPPPQFFPPTETESTERVCEKKGKKKKSCKKGVKVKSTSTERLDDYNVQEEEAEEEEVKGFNDADDKGIEADVEDEADEEVRPKGEKEDKKKKCRKRSERPTCRKKVSDVSISLLPPQIPPLQRDLPPKSPKDIPEVERQVMMACGARPDQKCKRRKEKVKIKRNSCEK